MVAMPARRILELGDPLLRAVSEPVSRASEARLILRDLGATLHEFRRRHGFGRGISAVQIGEPRRIIYLEFEGLPCCLINPCYEGQSAEKLQLWDDCFSFPDLLVYLERSLSVSVRYLDQTGAAQRLEATGALSELLQHEMDHLDGILAIDHALDRHSYATRAEFQRRFAAPKPGFGSEGGLAARHIAQSAMDETMRPDSRVEAIGMVQGPAGNLAPEEAVEAVRYAVKDWKEAVRS